MSRRGPGFDSDSSVDVPVLTPSVPGSDFSAPTSSIQAVGSAAIGKMLSQRNAEVEFPLAGKPKTFTIYNRAKLGNVKVWAAGFDSTMYPEDSTADRETWLQPGQEMNLPIEAVLHFFGNIFHPTFQGACDVIEACGGFHTEPRGELYASASGIAPPRIIGGPLFLPDFVITGKDGRNKVAFGPFELYVNYDKLTRRLWKNPILKNEALKDEESRLLEERLSEYRSADASIYGPDGEPIFSAPPDPPET